MQNITLPETELIGLALEGKTTNRGGRSTIDCGNLWQEFEKEDIAEKIPGKLSDEVFAVYHDYEGDHSQPFSYFIGCKVAPGTNVPAGLNSMTIQAGTFHKRTARGPMPDCVADSWKEIWNSDLQRAYGADFEIYDERSRDWNDAEVDIYLSVQ